jgi:hypothetical protein
MEKSLRSLNFHQSTKLHFPDDEMTTLRPDTRAFCINRNNPDLARDFTKQHCISTGMEDASFNLMSHDQNTSIDGLNTIDASMTTDLEMLLSSDVVYSKGEKSFAEYMKVIALGEKDGHLARQEDRGQISLVDVIAADTKSNISVMKSDVDVALFDTQSSQVHLVRNRDFIEKTRKKRQQCLRDLREHCCTCKGPHISKPSFGHRIDYHREPTHSQQQESGCLFLKKTWSELKSLDKTLDNYCKENERLELEIERCQAETQSRKEHMKEALANSLRLMEIASDAENHASNLHEEWQF